MQLHSSAETAVPTNQDVKNNVVEMVHPSILLNAYNTYYRYINPSIGSKTSKKLASEIAKEAWKYSQEILEYLITTQDSDIIKRIKEMYLLNTPRDEKENKTEGETKEEKEKELFKGLLVKQEHNYFRNSKNLADALEEINDRKKIINLKKGECAVYPNWIEFAKEKDLFVYESKYFTQIKILIQKLETNQNLIKETGIIFYMITLIHIVFSETKPTPEQKLNFLRPAMDAFLHYAPDKWQESVDFYSIIRKHELMPQGISKGEHIATTSEHAYRQIVYGGIIDLFMKELISEQLDPIKGREFQALWHHLGSKQAFKIHFIDYIYYESRGNNNLPPVNKIPEPKSPTTYKLYYWGVSCLITSLKNQYRQAIQEKNDQKTVKITDFLNTINASESKDPLTKEEIDAILSYWKSELNSKFAAFSFNQTEKKLIKQFICSLEIKIQFSKKKLLLFTETEKQLNSKKSVISDTVKKINEFRDEFSKRKDAGKLSWIIDLQQKIAPKLTELVKACDNIEVDFSTVSIPSNLQMNDNCQKFILNLLIAFESKYLKFLRDDFYYLKDFKEKNYEVLKDSLRFRANKNPFDVSSFDIYKNTVYKIEDSYSSNKSEITRNCNERDLIQELNQYAYDLLKEELSLGSSPKLPSHREFFVSCNILNEEGAFLTREEQMACAAIGYIEGKEGADASCEKIKETLLTVQNHYCSSCLSETDHLNWIPKEFLAFGTIAVLALPPLKKAAAIQLLCEKAKTITIAKDRIQQTALIVLLNYLLIQPKARIDSSTQEKVLDCILRRSLYPDQLGTIGRIQTQPYLKSFLEEKKAALQNPRLVNGKFPSPFYMYLYANDFARKENENRKAPKYLYKKENQITLVENFDLSNINNFYEICVLLQGVTWRLYKIDTPTNKKKDFSKALFSSLIESCVKYWEDPKPFKTEASEDLLKLTWASQLLLTSVSNLIREDHFINPREAFDPKKLVKIALLADFTQRRFNEEYCKVLNNDGSKPDFWLISGTHRYISSIYDRYHRFELKLFEENAEAIEFYESVLTWEKSMGNHRFYILIHRLLSFSDFFEQTKKEFPITNIGITLQNYKSTFLEYDNIRSYLEKKL